VKQEDNPVVIPTTHQTKRQMVDDKKPTKQESETSVVIPTANVSIQSAKRPPMGQKKETGTPVVIPRSIQAVEQKPVEKQAVSTVVSSTANITSGSKRNQKRNQGRQEQLAKNLPIAEEKEIDKKQVVETNPIVPVIKTESAIPKETETRVSNEQEEEKKSPETPVVEVSPEEPEIRLRPVQRHDLAAVEEQQQRSPELREQVESVIQSVMDNGPQIAVALFLTAIAGYLYRNQ
jgi:hypothetical protein